jgi:hydroxymethylglutaryl-CoA lyase
VALPARVRIYEVGPRDGLQNEATPVPTEHKLEYIALLREAGLREIEATSFVSPRAIPQLADADQLMRALAANRADAAEAPRYPVLVPNERGFERAEAAGADALAVFTAASDGFTQRNIGMSIAESLDAFRPVLARAVHAGWWTRAYVSTAFGCPFTGAVDPQRVVDVSLALTELGADEICIGDTIGVGTPGQVHELTARLVGAGLPLDRLAYHFHDTRGTALANVLAALEDGVACFDASTGGTGGCPYAPGAAGNLATEDLVYMLDGMRIDHGVDLGGVLRAARYISEALGRPLASKVGQAGGWDSETGAQVP